MQTQWNTSSTPPSGVCSISNTPTLSSGVALIDLEAQSTSVQAATEGRSRSRRRSSIFRAPNGGLGTRLESGRYVQDHAERNLVLLVGFVMVCFIFLLVAVGVAFG